MKKYISSLEDEKSYERIFFEIYTLINRKKIFLEYIELYTNLKNYDYKEFIEILKKNIASWDVFVVLLLKQSKRFNEKTKTRLVKKLSELIEEEKNMIERFEKTFS